MTTLYSGEDDVMQALTIFLNDHRGKDIQFVELNEMGDDYTEYWVTRPDGSHCVTGGSKGNGEPTDTTKMEA
jgi:hypothetical protein